MKNIIVYCILAAVNLITYPFKVKNNKITFICYCSDKLKRDFKLISRQLEKNYSYELVYVLTNYENSLKGNIAYLFNCMRQVYHVNTSKVVLLDYNNFVVSNFKKKEVKVIQVWHACGAIKKFGNDIEREYPIKNYDYILATSEEWKKHYSTAFGVSEESVLPIGIPLTDNLFSKEKMKKYKSHMLKKFPSIRGKKVIVYAPTFRGDPIYDIKYQDINLQYLKEQLGDEYVIIYKLHPSLGDRVIANDESIIDGNSESIKRLFSIADYLISDYSSVIFDFSIMKKPMIFFVPDLEEYKKDRGIYMNYEETMPGPICKTEEEIVEAILSEVSYVDKIEEFKNKYFKYRDGKSTERVVELIVSLCKGSDPLTKFVRVSDSNEKISRGKTPLREEYL